MAPAGCSRPPSGPAAPPGRWPAGNRPPSVCFRWARPASRVIFRSVTGAPVSTPRCSFSSRWVRISRCQLRSSTSSAAGGGEAGDRCPAPPAPAAGGPRHSAAGAQSGPRPPPARRWSPGRRCCPAPKSTSSPKRSANQLPQDLQLHLAHELHMDLPQLLVPAQCGAAGPPPPAAAASAAPCGHRPLGQQHPVGQHRLQHWAAPGAGSLPSPWPGIGVAQAGHGADRPRRAPPPPVWYRAPE